MLVKSFFSWMEKAPTQERIDAVCRLAAAYISKAFGNEKPEAVEAALTSVLDDPSPMVRKVLAVAFAERVDVPKHIVLSLANDAPEVSNFIISRSPLLADADLLDLISGIDTPLSILESVAKRNNISSFITKELLSKDTYEVMLALLENKVAEIKDDDILRAIDFFWDKADFRKALLKNSSLSASVRHAIIVKTIPDIIYFAMNGGFLVKKRAARLHEETLQVATLALSRRSDANLSEFCSYLREFGYLTPALLLRAVICLDILFLSAALSELSELSVSRILGIFASKSDSSIIALLRRAGLPDFILEVMVSSIKAATLEEHLQGKGKISIAVARAAQEACIYSKDEKTVRLLALLRKYETEAVRSDSMQLADNLKSEFYYEEEKRKGAISKENDEKNKKEMLRRRLLEKLNNKRKSNEGVRSIINLDGERISSKLNEIEEEKIKWEKLGIIDKMPKRKDAQKKDRVTLSEVISSWRSEREQKQNRLPDIFNPADINRDLNHSYDRETINESQKVVLLQKLKRGAA